jgi:hypothetical protein
MKIYHCGGLAQVGDALDRRREAEKGERGAPARPSRGDGLDGQ